MLTSILYFAYASTEPTSAVPIFLVAALFGTARAFVSPAMRSIPPLVAPLGGLPRLMALYAVTWQAGLIIGPATSGLLYDHDPATPYVAAALCFAVSAAAIAVLRVRHRQVRTPAEQKTTLHHAMEGLRFIRGRQVLFGAIALDLFAVLFGGAVALLPAIAEDRLHVGNIGYGWLRAAPGVGAVGMALLLAIRPLRRRIGRWLLFVVAVFGAGTMVLGLTHSYTVAFSALVVLSAADAVSVFIRTTIVPLATPDHMRGRVSAVENVFVGASNEVGSFESGVASAFDRRRPGGGAGRRDDDRHRRRVVGDLPRTARRRPLRGRRRRRPSRRIDAGGGRPRVAHRRSPGALSIRRRATGGVVQCGGTRSDRRDRS